MFYSKKKRSLFYFVICYFHLGHLSKLVHRDMFLFLIDTQFSIVFLHHKCRVKSASLILQSFLGICCYIYAFVVSSQLCSLSPLHSAPPDGEYSFLGALLLSFSGHQLSRAQLALQLDPAGATPAL